MHFDLLFRTTLDLAGLQHKNAIQCKINANVVLRTYSRTFVPDMKERST